VCWVTKGFNMFPFINSETIYKTEVPCRNCKLVLCLAMLGHVYQKNCYKKNPWRNAAGHNSTWFPRSLITSKTRSLKLQNGPIVKSHFKGGKTTKWARTNTKSIPAKPCRANIIYRLFKMGGSSVYVITGNSLAQC